MPEILVKDITSTPVVTFFAEQTLPLAEDVMCTHRFRHLPVIDNDHRLVGLITQRDLLRDQIRVPTGLTESERRARQEDIRIRRLMTRDVWTVPPETRSATSSGSRSTRSNSMKGRTRRCCAQST